MFLKYLLSKLSSESGQVEMTPTQESKPEDTQNPSQAQQAEKLEGLIEDIDLSDVPVEQRDTVKKYLFQKVKQYDAGFRSKTEDVSKEKKELEQKRHEVNDLLKLREEIQGNPELEKQITKMINNARAGVPIVENKETTQALKKLDKYIENAPDAETRESLQTMREIIKDEISGVGIKDDEIKALKEEIKSIRNATQMSQAERIDSKLSKLKDRFGKDIVNKYENDIRTAALKYPGQDIDKLFRYVASDDDLRNAYIKEAEKNKKREQELKEEGTSPRSSGIRTPIKVEKDKFGRTNIRDLVSKVLNKK